MGKAAKRVSPGELKRRAMLAARPSMEALLLAAVALGCAQFGWSVFSPNTAHSTAPEPTPTDDQTSVAAADIRTPFTPGDTASASHATAALLGSVRLSGVRLAEEAERSGAILTLEDGGQRAFRIGQDIAPGVRLTDVKADYVVVAFDGGERRLAMEAETAPRFSFSRALMGQAQEATPPEGVEIAPAPQALSEADAAWLASAFSNVETADGAARGWRVQGPAPEALAAAGVRDGDLITAINGVGPDRGADAVNAATSGRIELSVERDGGMVTLQLGGDQRA